MAVNYVTRFYQIFKLSFFIPFIFCLSLACGHEKSSQIVIPSNKIQLKENSISLIILGTIQDAGSPQIDCLKKCCINLYEKPDQSRKVTSLGLIDNINQQNYLMEASPDIVTQLEIIQNANKQTMNNLLNGIFLTHAHIGHYTGLMYFGKEAMDSNNTTIYAMPRMKDFLNSNGPWDQLVKRENIKITDINDEVEVKLSSELQITPFLVPHRDEYSETVGYKIKGPNKTALFIPDIDKWDRWEKDIVEEVKKVDYAFLDATFYSGEELNNRDIHFNHTNPVLNKESKEYAMVVSKGFNIAKYLDVFHL